MDKELLRPMDVVEFKKGFSKHTGIVLEIFSLHIIVYFDKTNFKMINIDNVNVIDVYRNWAYGYTFDLFSQQDMVFSLVTSPKANYKKLFRGLNRKLPKDVMSIYFMTASEVSYPDAYLTEKITLEQLISAENGYTQVYE